MKKRNTKKTCSNIDKLACSRNDAVTTQESSENSSQQHKNSIAATERKKNNKDLFK